MARRRKRKTVRRRRATAKAKPRRRRASGTVKLNAAGIKKVADLSNVLYALAGIVGMRAAYALVSRYLPDQDAKLRAIIAAGATAAGGIMIAGGKLKKAAPVAAGALAGMLLDVFGPDIAEALASQPDIAVAIRDGAGRAPAFMPAAGGEVADWNPYTTPSHYGLAGWGDDPRDTPSAYGGGGLSDVSFIGLDNRW